MEAWRSSMREPNTKMFLLCLFLQFLLRTSTSLDSLNPSQSLRENQTLLSSNQTFELGFFRQDDSVNHYLGIWYKKSVVKTIVWVANRETPLVDSFGTLNLTHQGVFVLFDGNNRVVWTSGNTTTAQNPVLQLLDTGNLVVKSGQNFLWQSFDYLSNTLLPEMKIGKNFKNGHETFLTSWKTNKDPSRGQFSLRMDLRGFPQMFVWNGSVAHYRWGSWNGVHFTGTPELPEAKITGCNFQFEMNRNEVYYKCVNMNTYVTRLVINELGFVERSIRRQTGDWLQIYAAPQNDCDYYNVCGADAICDVVNNSSSCDCMEGFVPKNVQEWSRKNWSGGCVRKSPVECQRKDGFQKQTGLKLPDTSGSWFNTSMSLEDCKEVCFRNCSCIAYATSDIKKGLGCLIWSGKLLDIRRLDGGQDIYIRMGTSKPAPGMNKKMRVVIIVCSVVLGFLIVGVLVYIRKYKLRKKGEKDVMDLPIFALADIAKATDNFSIDNKLGQGGFGPVYKGIWKDGQEIAVKKLSKSSGQGLTEFKNEVILIAKLQHRNLVRLLGCCIEGEEQLLVYEYMPNKSLDFFIFDEMKRNLLDWHKRLHIIDGIARGILYLHQDSRLRIIHRDLKASNVLLDKDMNPKISDFGLARMVGVDETEANTNRVVGTYGYMSPEYAVDGLFSVKSDVFSFGVLLLEIVSGKKNRGFSHPDHNHNLLGHAWKLWIEKKSLELTDSTLIDSFVHSQVLRCIHVGLLCVQQRPEDRPNMSAVVLMLNSETSLPDPKQPGFFTERNMPDAESSSASRSKNEVSISTLEPR